MVTLRSQGYSKYMDEQAKVAVRRFLVRARHHPEMGSYDALAERVSSYGRGYEIKAAGVGHWFRGIHQPAAWILFALAVDLDISLDDLVFGERSQANRLANLEAQVFDLMNWKEATERPVTSTDKQE